MDKMADLTSRIRKSEEQLRIYQDKIHELERKLMQLFEAMQQKKRLQFSFQQFRERKHRQFSQMNSEVSDIKFAVSFSNNMLEKVSGNKAMKTEDSIQRAIQSLCQQIEDTEQEIAQLKASYGQCDSLISSLYNQRRIETLKVNRRYLE